MGRGRGKNETWSELHHPCHGAKHHKLVVVGRLVGAGAALAEANGRFCPMYEPFGPPLPLGAALGWRVLHAGEAMVLVHLQVPGRSELPQKQLCGAEPLGLLSC